MIILAIRTDKPEAEVGVYANNEQLAYEVWTAHRELGTTIHLKIEAVLTKAGKTMPGVQGIVCFQGPGSFTGLRIGLSVANALAYALRIPIVACQDPRWLEAGIAALLAGQNDTVVLPEYGAEANVTPPRK